MHLLLDGHIDPAVAVQLRLLSFDVVTLDDWRGGQLRHASDRDILLAAAEEGRILVTFDLRTVPGLLEELAGEGEYHAGVIFVNNWTIRQNDVGGLVRSLRNLLEEDELTDWTNVPIFLPVR